MAEQVDSWRSGGNAPSSWGRGGAFAGGSTRGGGGRGGGAGRGARGGAAGLGRGGGGSSGGAGRKGGKGGGGTAAAVLPTLMGPMHSMNFITDYYHHILTSGKIQAKWLENPKNPMQNYISARTLQPPNYQSEQGYVEGRREATFRVTLLADQDHDIVGYGDAKQLKEAEKIAALHAMLQLEDRNLLSAKPTGPAKGQVAPPPGPSATMSDGTKIAPERAREYLEFFCETYKCGKPEIVVQEASKARGRKGVASGWRAQVAIAGSVVGEASATNKKAATNSVHLVAAQNLAEGEHAGVWKQFNLTHKPGAPVSAAPHVVFRMSDELADDVNYLYGDIRESMLFQKAPRYTIGGPDAAKGKRREIGSVVRNMSEDALASKSKRLEEDLYSYQSDDRVKAMRAQRASLPVQQKASDVLIKIELNQVSIIMAATGSGKTTQIPQIIFDDHITQGQGAKCNIICTQPRRIAAISVADRVAKERGERVGQTVGYQVRFEHKLPQDHGSITFCTTGIFLRRLQSALGDSEASNNFLDNLTHIVVDEVHERDVETDLLLVVIKRLLAERKRLGKHEIKLILMSATIDPTLFQNYFPDQTGRPAPVVEIPGRSFPVDKHYLEETVRHLHGLDLPLRAGGWVFREKNVVEYLERELNQRGGVVTRRDPNGAANGGENEAVDAIDDLEIPYPLVALMIADVLASSDDGHVLVFMPGWEEIKAVNLILTDTMQRPLLGTNFNDGNKYEIHILHSSIPVADQQAVFEPVRHKGIRRIILATNIAETSITIPDVVYVVDTGRVKEKRFDPERHLSSLVSAWVGTSNLNQRAGRAGRHRAGEYYGVLSKARYDRLSVNQTVEMKRVDLSNVVMHIKALDIPGMEVEDVLDAAIEPPAPERVRAAMDKLIMVGALAEDKSLTSLGHVLLQLPVDAPMGKMCLYGAFFRCLEPTLTLAAVLTNRDPFMAPLQLKKEADAVKDSWCPTDFRSDSLATLKAYTKWADLQASGQIRASHQFCTDNFLSRTTLAQIQQVKEHLFQSMEKAGILDVVLAASVSGSNEQNKARRPPPTGPRRGGPRGRWIDETHPDLNSNSDCTPLLAALIALASTPNFAIRHSEKVYRTSQDKNVYIHPSSVCHNRHTKHKEGESFQGERELYAFAEKMKNVSMVGGQSNSGGGQTMLKTVTRLDPLTYMLFGASKAKSANGGIMCDDWLPIRGDSVALDDLERVKRMLDLCMLRVFEGIGSGGVVLDEEIERERERRRRRREREQQQSRKKNGASGHHGEEKDQANGQGDGGAEEEEEDLMKEELRMSQREVDDFHHLTMGLVRILDGYAIERNRYSQSNSRNSTRPATPTTVTSGVTSIWSHSQGYSNGSGRESPYGSGYSMAAPSLGFESLSSSARPSDSNKSWRR